MSRKAMALQVLLFSFCAPGALAQLDIVTAVANYDVWFGLVQSQHTDRGGSTDLELAYCLQAALATCDYPELAAEMGANAAQALADIGPDAETWPNGGSLSTYIAFMAYMAGSAGSASGQEWMAALVDEWAEPFGAPGTCGDGYDDDGSCYTITQIPTVEAIFDTCYARKIGEGGGKGNLKSLAPVEINQHPDQPDPAESGPVLFDVLFSDPVIGFDADNTDDVDVLFTGTATIISYAVTGSGAQYTLRVIAAHGTVIPIVPEGAAINGCSQLNAVSTSVDNTVAVGVDTDGDQFTDDEEAAAGTNPSDAGERPMPGHWRALFDSEAAALYTARGFSYQDDDLDADRFEDRIQLGMAGTVLGYPFHPRHDSVMMAFRVALAMLRGEPTFEAALQPYAHGLAGLLIVSEAMALFWSEELGLAGTYRPYAAGETLFEPFTYDGDLDGDGFSNGTEYGNVLAGGLSEDTFWDVVIDSGAPAAAAAAAEPIPRAPLDAWPLLLVLLPMMVLGYRRFTRRKSEDRR